MKSPDVLSGGTPDAVLHSSEGNSIFADAYSFAQMTGKSFLYSAVQSPIDGVAQLVDAACGTHTRDSAQLFSRPEQSEFGTADWHAQQIGGGLGIAADLIVAHTAFKCIAPGLGKTFVGEPTAFNMMGRGALTGAVYEGIFSPSNQQSGESLWTSRLKQAGTGAVTFGAVAGASAGLRSMTGFSTAQDGLTSKLLRSNLVNGLVAGSLGGIAGANTESLLSGKGLASVSENVQSAYAFAVAGAPLGIAHSFSMNSPALEKSTIQNSKQIDSLNLQSAPPLFESVKLRSALAANDEARTDRSADIDRYTDDSYIANGWQTPESPGSTELAKTLDRVSFIPNQFDITADRSGTIDSVTTQRLDIERLDQNGEFQTVNGSFKVYKFKGSSAEVLVPESANAELENIRQGRQLAANIPAEQRAESAKFMESMHPGFSTRVLPEQVPDFLSELPNPNLVRRVVLWSDGPKTSAANAGEEGLINLFHTPTLDPYIMRFHLFHEWAHLTLGEAVPNSEMQNAAIVWANNLEKDGYYSRPYAATDDGENLAVHLGEDFVNPDADQFYAFVKQAPIRATIFAEVLKNQLEQAAESGNPSPHQTQLMERVNTAQREALPKARAEITDAVLSTDADKATPALRLLYSTYRWNPDLMIKLVDTKVLNERTQGKINLDGAKADERPMMLIMQLVSLAEEKENENE